MPLANKNIGSKVKDARKQRGLTQKDLAEKLGRTIGAISQLEQGKVQISAVDLHSIGDLLNKPIEYFYGENYTGDDVQDLIAIVRKMEPKERADLLPTISSILEMQHLAEDMIKLDEGDPKLVELGKKFLDVAQVYNSKVGSLSSSSKEAQEKLASIFKSLETNLKEK